MLSQPILLLQDKFQIATSDGRSRRPDQTESNLEILSILINLFANYFSAKTIHA